jgi:hypothetical protein
MKTSPRPVPCQIWRRSKCFVHAASVCLAFGNKSYLRAARSWTECILMLSGFKTDGLLYILLAGCPPPPVGHTRSLGRRVLTFIRLCACIPLDFGDRLMVYTVASGEVKIEGSLPALAGLPALARLPAGSHGRLELSTLHVIIISLCIALSAQTATILSLG